MMPLGVWWRTVCYLHVRDTVKCFFWRMVFEHEVKCIASQANKQERGQVWTWRIDHINVIGKRPNNNHASGASVLGLVAFSKVE